MIEAAAGQRTDAQASDAGVPVAVLAAVVAMLLEDRPGREQPAPVRLAVREVWPRVSPWRYLGRL